MIPKIFFFKSNIREESLALLNLWVSRFLKGEIIHLVFSCQKKLLIKLLGFNWHVRITHNFFHMFLGITFKENIHCQFKWMRYYLGFADGCSKIISLLNMHLLWTVLSLDVNWNYSTSGKVLRKKSETKI